MRIWSLPLALIALTGCARTYLIDVARSATHVTFASTPRPGSGSQSEFLVDCLVGPGGRPTNCVPVALPKVTQ